MTQLVILFLIDWGFYIYVTTYLMKRKKKYNIYIDVKHKIENYNILLHKFNLFEFTKSVSIFEYYVWNPHLMLASHVQVCIHAKSLNNANFEETEWNKLECARDYIFWFKGLPTCIALCKDRLTMVIQMSNWKYYELVFKCL